MKLLIIIPAHNEEKQLAACLDSFVQQHVTPDALLLVNDNSTDKTLEIAETYSQKHAWIKVISNTSSEAHIPGKKVVDTFNYGVAQNKEPYDLIGKFDADIILPPNYFEEVVKAFIQNPKLGMCSGLLYIKKEDAWVYEPIANTTHIRGPIKLYSKSCYTAIGGLRASIGWDTVDELLAQYHGFKTLTLTKLHAKHLRPTGTAYHKKAILMQGEALYKMRYGFVLTCIASAKMAAKSKKPKAFFHNLKGYFKAKKQQLPFMVNTQEGAFIRKLRWKAIKAKLF